jgi:transcriptional regulator with XRE-family HTH domain
VIRTNADRAVRALRRRAGWRQQDVGDRAGVSRQLVSRIESGTLAGLTVHGLDRVAAALGATLWIEVRWRGEQLDRLIDSGHARIQADVAQLLEKSGWLVRVEVSFNRFGERGRCDILAFHPRTRSLVVVEVKSRLANLQETVGRLDTKVRLGRYLAGELGWSAPDAVLPMLVVGDGRTARRVVAAHAPLFGRFDRRGRAAVAWIRHPAALRTPRGPAPRPAGLLVFQPVGSDSHRASAMRGGRVRTKPDSHVV